MMAVFDLNATAKHSPSFHRAPNIQTFLFHGWRLRGDIPAHERDLSDQLLLAMNEIDLSGRAGQSESG
jgi:hypothetical protein